MAFKQNFSQPVSRPSMLLVSGLLVFFLALPAARSDAAVRKPGTVAWANGWITRNLEHCTVAGKPGWRWISTRLLFTARLDGPADSLQGPISHKQIGNYMVGKNNVWRYQALINGDPEGRYSPKTCVNQSLVFTPPVKNVLFRKADSSWTARINRPGQSRRSSLPSMVVRFNNHWSKS